MGWFPVNVFRQGFQLLVDTYDGFGGLASAVLDDIADDYSNKAVVCFATTPAVFPELVRIVLRLLLLNEISTKIF